MVLVKEDWHRVLNNLNVSSGLIADRANARQRNVTLAPRWVDFLHQQYLCIQPAHRVAYQRFRTNGLLLPFAASRAVFTIPNL